MKDRERDIDAAERAIGTQPIARETLSEQRARQDWEQRLAPLLDAFSDAIPSDHVLTRIDAEIDRDIADRAHVTKLERTSRHWRSIAILASSMAAALLLWIALLTQHNDLGLVAVVTSDADDAPGMVVKIATDGAATIIPVGAAAPDGRSVEMWFLPAGATKPRSLGLLPEAAIGLNDLIVGPGDIFALSFEDPGGSPTGQPTDPRYHGKVTEVASTSSN